MKVKVIEDFRDRTADLKLRKAGETLEVDAERAQKLAGLGLAETVTEEPAKAAAAEETKAAAGDKTTEKG